MNSVRERIVYVRIGLIILIALFIASFVIHMPINVQYRIFNRVLISEPVYSDIVLDDYNTILVNPCRGASVEKWFNKTLLSKYCRGEYYSLIPYRDYSYRHSSMNGFLWYLMIKITHLLTTNSAYTPVFIDDASYTVFYITYSTTIFFFLLVFYIYLDKLYRLLNVESFVLKISSVLLSSLAVYVIYSWEFIHLTILVIALYYYLVERYSYYYLFLGLLICFNPLGFTILFLTIYSGLHNKLFVIDKRVVYLFLGLIPLYIHLAISPYSLLKQIMWFTYDYCNNCVYLIITNDPYSQVTRGLAIASLLVSITVFLAYKPLKPTVLYKYAYIVLFIGIVISLNLVFTPQTVLLILPLLPPIYSAFRELKLIISHYIIDILNSSIIIVWFKDALLRKTLSFLGLPVVYNPLSIDSPVQWIAQSRNIALITITIILATNYLEIKTNTKNINKQLV